MYISKKIETLNTDHSILLEELSKADTGAFIKKINKTVFRPVDIPLTSRIINHWHEKGVFPYQKEPGKWREFSFVDYIWVLFVKRLRNFGVGLPNVIKIKAQCFDSLMPLFKQTIAMLMSDHEPGELRGALKEGMGIISDAGGLEGLSQSFEDKELRLFSLWLMVTIKNNQDVLMRIQSDENNTTDFVMLTEETTNTEQIVQTIAQKGGLFISMKSLLNEFYGSDHFDWENIQLLEVDQEAKRVIAIMREKGLKEVVVSFANDGSVKRVQTKKPPVRMTQTEFNNFMIGKSHMECRSVKQDGDELIVSVKQNHKLD